MEQLESLVEWFEELGESITDFIDEMEDFSIEDTDFYMDAEDACSEGIMGCVDYFTSLPAEYVALVVFSFLAVLYIILRIFHWIFRDAEVW